MLTPEEYEEYDAVYGTEKSLPRGVFVGKPPPPKDKNDTSEKIWDTMPLVDEEYLYAYCYRTKCFGIPYQISSRFTEQQQNKIRQGIREVESESCVR